MKLIFILTLQLNSTQIFGTVSIIWVNAEIQEWQKFLREKEIPLSKENFQTIWLNLKLKRPKIWT